MLAYSIIERKQNGFELSKDELSFFINGFVNSSIPDYQMSALLMAIYFQGMIEKEVSNLIQIIIDSGEHKKFRDEGIYYADKHSTGGVGDKISIILAPLLAATGTIRIPMISGRGLGHSGGTLDKLESIPGFNTQLSMEAFEKQTKEIGCALIGQTENICPADKKLYALRDVTATVRSIPLICGSILSKKIAEGIQGLVLDVKTGSGAFMQTYEDSKKLAENLVKFGNAFGVKTKAHITDMNQPLGQTVGNWLEIEESLEVLQGGGPEDVRKLSLDLSVSIMQMAEPHRKPEDIHSQLVTILDSGQAFDKFCEITKVQGGDTTYLTGKKVMGSATYQIDVIAESNAYISSINNYQLGLDSIQLGAGRQQQSDVIDPLAGLRVKVRIGDKVKNGDTLVTLYSEKEDSLKNISRNMKNNFVFSNEKPEALPLVYEEIG